MTSFRPKNDKAWNYVRPLPSTQKYLYMAPIASNIFECVVLDGLTSKVASNSDDPPSSFHTGDTFIPHPTIPNAWKYLGRLDDRVTLVNGEKVLPIPYEHQIRSHPLVAEACVFGVGRAFPGLIIIPSEKALGKTRSELLEVLWPVVQNANQRVETFSHVSREMIEFLEVGAEYPRTDKGTIIRAAFYKAFEQLINSIYERFETPNHYAEAHSLNLSELQHLLSRLFAEHLGFPELTATTDFFEAGVDSLQAISARALMIRELGLDPQLMGQNVVFEYPNIESLAGHLYSLQTGQERERKNEIEVMDELIRKYSSFNPHHPGNAIIDGETVVGSLTSQSCFKY